ACPRSGRGGCSLKGGPPILARLVLQRGVLQLALDHVGKLYVPDRALGGLDLLADALVSACADAHRPRDRLALADLRLPVGADLAQIVGEGEAGARAVGPTQPGAVG